MSFTSDIKNELCLIPSQQPCCALAECLGLLLYAGQLSPGRIRFQAGHPAVRRRACMLIKQVFDITVTAVEGVSNASEITSKQEIGMIYDAFTLAFKNAPLQLNRALIEDECCKNAFIRGAFLMGGYVSASGKGYHLELVTSHFNVSRQVSALLSEMDMPPGSVLRRGNYVLYYKDSVMIEDFLSTAGATQSAMSLMLKKVERDLRNKVNRKVNCDTANLGKTVDAAARQLEAIEKLQSSCRLESLSQPLRDTARLRIDNPEMSLSELCELANPPVSRPGLAGRLRRLIEIADSD